MSHLKRVSSVLAGVAAASAVVAAPASASQVSSHHRQQTCARQFGHAVHAYLATTARHDARGFERLMARDYTVILPDGTVFAGKKAASGFIDTFFARTDWTQSFDEQRRAVEGCRSAFVLYDSVYTDADGPEPLVIGLSWTYRHGRWLVLQDQNTPDATP